MAGFRDAWRWGPAGARNRTFWPSAAPPTYGRPECALKFANRSARRPLDCAESPAEYFDQSFRSFMLKVYKVPARAQERSRR